VNVGCPTIARDGIDVGENVCGPATGTGEYVR
jgi:hypothetical protein